MAQSEGAEYDQAAMPSRDHVDEGGDILHTLLVSPAPSGSTYGPRPDLRSSPLPRTRPQELSLVVVPPSGAPQSIPISEVPCNPGLNLAAASLPPCRLGLCTTVAISPTGSSVQCSIAAVTCRDWLFLPS